MEGGAGAGGTGGREGEEEASKHETRRILVTFPALRRSIYEARFFRDIVPLGGWTALALCQRSGEKRR
jgi:hypothetical protein